jgi:hypothetical protein
MEVKEVAKKYDWNAIFKDKRLKNLKGHIEYGQMETSDENGNPVSTYNGCFNISVSQLPIGKFLTLDELIEVIHDYPLSQDESDV